MASWTGTTPYATKKQLVSSISGLYTDLQDISGLNFQNLTVSTLTAELFISTPVLYVSSIVGATIDISGIIISDEGILNAPVVSLSSLSFKGFDSLLDLDVSFDLGLGQAIGGLAAGLGVAVGSALIAVGTGAGLAIQGAEQGIATMVAGRPQNFISQTNYETINFTSQLQISTLGNAYPAYSSIFRTVSSVSADQVPGREIFTSTLFYPGQICIRSCSDPFNLISGNSNLNSSTIQSFGQWVPLPEEPGLISSFTGILLSNATDTPLLEQYREIQSINNAPMMNSFQEATSSNNLPFAVNTTPYPNTGNINNIFYHRDEYLLTNSFISTPYIRFQSTFTSLPPTYFLRSTISTPCEITYSNILTDANIAICEPDETGFRSTATMDFIAKGQDIFIQWGLAAGNFNSTIAAGTAKRVSWNIPANTSNFIDIPQAVSTITNEATQQIIDLKTNPYEIQFNTFGTGMAPSQIAFNINGATFGSNTSLSNATNYPYQFNSNLYVNGTIEAQTIIALSSIFATSTFVDTQISTASIVADVAQITELYNREGYISTLRSTSNNPGNDYITTLSRVRMAGFQTPLSIITGKGTNVYDTSARFDFNTDTFPQAVYLESQPANNTLMYIFSTNIEIPNLTVENLTANNIVYSNAEAPTIKTSTIAFGWTGNFNTLPTPEFSLQQSLITEPGLVWNNYQAASNQTLNIMAFSNTVNMLAQQFSTPLTYLNTTFDGTNRQGWASTIFYNAQATPCRVNLGINAGAGEVSLQGQTYGVIVSMNTAENVEGLPVNVPVGSTYKFTSGGASWTTLSNAPTPGIVQYNNTLQMTMDFENTNLTVTDTLNINAEQINLNGSVSMSQPQFVNLFVDTFVSTSQVIMPRTYTGAIANQGTYTPINITNTVTSTDFPNIKATINPNRGFNAFNSVNFNEWNNSMYNIDVTASSGSPVMALGDLIIKSPPTTYAGQFFINNTIDSPGSNIPLYVNVNGLLSSIGNAPTGQYTRVFTSNGSLWSFQSNVPNPSGLGGYTYPNFYTMSMNSLATLVQVGQPLIEQAPSRTMTAAKIILDTPSVRVNTMASPSFPSKESGFEFNSYFDANVVFTGSESEAINPIPNSLNNYFYSVAGWSAQCWFGRIRTNQSIQGFDILGIAVMYTGTPGDFIWASQRFLNITSLGSLDANIREMYFMTPKNYHTPPSFLTQ